MKRRIAHKVVNAMIAGTSRHRTDTRRRALAVVHRDLRRGRLDALFLVHRLGLVDLVEWLDSKVFRPMTRALEAVGKALKPMADAMAKVARDLVRAFGKVKIPPSVRERIEAGHLVLEGGPDPALVAELEAYPPD